MLSSHQHWSILLLPTTFLATGLAVWYRYHYIKKRKESEALQLTKPSYRVLFFPDEATARSFTSHSEISHHEGSLFVLMNTLQSAERSLDVCIFTFSCKELRDILVRAHRNGVVVRVITDGEQVAASGSQIESLRRAGIQVRHDCASYFMHHKFAIVDEKTIASGSLNWTLQGVCGNQENVVILDAPEVVLPFSKHFERLWDMYDPEKQDH